MVYEGNRGIWRAEGLTTASSFCPFSATIWTACTSTACPVRGWDAKSTEPRFPVINAGSPDAHPAHTLADISCMLRCSRYLDTINCAWIGCVNGTLPFSDGGHGLVSVPAACGPADPGGPRRPLQEAVERLGSSVTFVDSPKEAVKGANYVFAGCRSGLTAEERACWRVDAGLLSLAEPNVRLLLSASPGVGHRRGRRNPCRQGLFAGAAGRISLAGAQAHAALGFSG